MEIKTITAEAEGPPGVVESKQAHDRTARRGPAGSGGVAGRDIKNGTVKDGPVFICFYSCLTV